MLEANLWGEEAPPNVIRPSVDFVELLKDRQVQVVANLTYISAYHTKECSPNLMGRSRFG